MVLRVSIRFAMLTRRWRRFKSWPFRLFFAVLTGTLLRWWPKNETTTRPREDENRFNYETRWERGTWTKVGAATIDEMTGRRTRQMDVKKDSVRRNIYIFEIRLNGKTQNNKERWCEKLQLLSATTIIWKMPNTIKIYHGRKQYKKN